MDDLIVRKLCRIGTGHLNQCEDSILYIEDSRFIHAAVFDGCSTGVDSHFASALISKILRKCIHNSFLIEEFGSPLGISSLYDIQGLILRMLFNELKSVKKALILDWKELLSTIIYVVIDKKEDNMSYRVSGDGFLIRDQQRICIESEDNAPDYLAHHLDEDLLPPIIGEASDNADKFERIIIATDGLSSFKLSGNVTQEGIEKYLFDDTLIKSEAMFERKCNILSKKGVTHSDDLSIIMIKNLNPYKND